MCDNLLVLCVQLRVSAIRLMHIVMVTKPEAFMENDVLKDARTRCISLFFKSLTSRADQVFWLVGFFFFLIVVVRQIRHCILPGIKHLTVAYGCSRKVS